MPYDVATTGLIEEALSEVFQYHRELDMFISRAGLTTTDLTDAREKAEARSALSSRGFDKAPKRFVAQEILAGLALGGASGDQILAAIVTGLVRGKFPNCSAAGKVAVEALRQKVGDDRAEQESIRKAKAAEIETQQTKARQARESALAVEQAKRDGFQQRFLDLMKESNAQSRGYLLETFANDLFHHEGLEPRKSFKLVGEQIDGSIIWNGKLSLVEVKWVQEPVSGAQFGAFQFKIEGKTADTRGLYISINGYSPQAIQALGSKGALKFVCLDGTHIMRALEPGQRMSDLLKRVWRHADETGEPYLPANRM